MKVAILANPKAGKGRGRAVSATIDAALRAEGHSVAIVPFASPETSDAIRHAALTSDVLVIAGGDGTVHYALPALADAPAAVYHLPMGTENLFAREFRTDAKIPTLLAALDDPDIRTIDLPQFEIGGRSHPFAIMASIGPDAGVIRRLHELRTGPITHLSYLRPTLAELANPYLPTLTIATDGREIVGNSQGLLVVANARQYALRADPAAGANPADGLLDLVFMPTTTPLDALGRLIDARLRSHRSEVIQVRAATVRVISNTPNPAVQADGELVWHGRPPLDLTLRITGRRLRVLAARGTLGCDDPDPTFG